MGYIITWHENIFWLAVHKREVLHTLRVFVGRDYIVTTSRERDHGRDRMLNKFNYGRGVIGV